MEDEIYGTPVLRSIFNPLLDLDKILSAGGEAAWKTLDPGKHFDLEPDVQAAMKDGSDLPNSSDLASHPDILGLKNRIKEFDDGLTRSLLTSGVKLNTIQSRPTNFGPMVDCLIQIICAAKGLQQRILMGTERGELASSQDRNNGQMP